MDPRRAWRGSPSGRSGLTNVFLYDVSSGVVRLVSGAGSSATITGSDYSDSPALDADGSAVAFRSNATNLVGGLVSGSNVYEFDAPSGTVALVSHQAGRPTSAGAGSSQAPSIDSTG